MLKKNLTPFFVGTKITSRRPPQPEMTVFVRGTFRLAPGVPVEAVEGIDQGFLSAEVYQEGDDERLGEVLYPGDFADFKLNAEVMLAGTCHPPGGAAVTACPVRFSVGAWSKTLHVMGDRRMRPVVGPTPPQPFTAMPLTWANAYGGPGFAPNPVGKGVGGDAVANLEYPGQVLGAPDARGRGGVGPVNPNWAPRAGKVGQAYGGDYKRTRAPFYAEDFDWSFFSAAPPDQQIAGFLRGDEEMTFANLHPAAPSFAARLPGLRLRAFIEDDAGDFRSAPMKLDTLFIDLDKGLLYLTWRGLVAVRELDLADVKWMLVASEPLASEPLPEAHYLGLLRDFARDPTGVLAALPEGLREAGEAMALRRAGGPPPTPPPDAPDPVTGALQAQFGKLLPAGAAESVAAGIARAREAVGPERRAAFEEQLASAAAAANEDRPIPARSIKPGAFPSNRLKEQIRGVMARVAEMKAALPAGQAPQGIEAADALPHDPRWVQLDPGYSVPGPLSTDEPGPRADLVDRDLRGLDLRGRDLSGANLSGADLSGADLTGATLIGANLKFALLYKTVLAGADLTRADLSLANLAYVKAPGAVLAGAVLEQTFFERADLTGADLTGARGEYAIFTAAKLQGLRASRAELAHSDFGEADLGEADLREAGLARCAFTESRALRADLSGARIDGASFSEADFSGARFVEARGVGCYFMKARLDGADLTGASLKTSHFTEASAVEARFYGANLRECRFYRAMLDRAQFVRANLFAADLCKAHLSGTRFTSANLYDAKLIGASGVDCDFTDANLRRSTLESV